MTKRQARLCLSSLFWHWHADLDCKIARLPRSNREYWLSKLERNAARDAVHQENLMELGWKALVIQGCEVRGTAHFWFLGESEGFS